MDYADKRGVAPSCIEQEIDPLQMDLLLWWRHIQGVKCPGCGRPLSQHLRSDLLNREETYEDYTAYSYECPSQVALRVSQKAWRDANKSQIDAYNKGEGPDPHQGVFWMSRGPGETPPPGVE